MSSMLELNPKTLQQRVGALEIQVQSLTMTVQKMLVVLEENDKFNKGVINTLKQLAQGTIGDVRQ